jgi:hypothetical protein
MSINKDSLFVWGIDGELPGNEGRLMACLPFLTHEGTPGVMAARALDWSVDPEHNLLHLASEEQALELGDRLTFVSPLPARPGTLVAVLGPELQRSLVALVAYRGAAALYSELTRAGSLSAENFFAISLDSTAYERIGLRMAWLAKAAFDQEISTTRGVAVTPVAEAALSVLKGNTFTKLEELVIRRLISARIKKDADTYRTASELAALRLKESPEKIEELVESHFRILVEKSPFGVRRALAPSLDRSRFGSSVSSRKTSPGIIIDEAEQGRPVYLYLKKLSRPISEGTVQRQVTTKAMNITRFRALGRRITQSGDTRDALASRAVIDP